MNKKHIGWITAIIFLLVLTTTACSQTQGTSNIKVSSNGSTATLFFHGWGSSSKAEDFMAQGIKDSGATKTIIKANVDLNKKVTFDRNFSSKTKNPVIEVNIEDNKLNHVRNSDNSTPYQAGSEYVKAAIQAVEKKTKSKNINLVGHSMGNLEIINYINLNVNKKNFPNIKHMIAIAGHYDGIIGMNDRANQIKLNKNGKPNVMRPEYRQLLSLRKTFPKNTRVLNIYGDLQDGSHSDGDVANNSSRSLKYLINNRAKSYQELKISGKNAQHSKLHHNVKVNDAIVRFLFN
ncbi:putative alpha/beta hydrolase family protein [Lactobacillus colini]|uniref:Alpha/beta hydrolase family protein n=1 Tax=Lactobacillus colini TaxID=1819254 RepID=A0ABS4MCQ2_9LACO|nr:alpha/beta hydrolase [Lactobacillus colini]MBP2057106.1 putative alpha/beta hydrolase family protein [Lactobacillus colini]